MPAAGLIEKDLEICRIFTEWIALLKLLTHWIDTEELWMSIADPHLSINIKITYMALTLDP